MKKWIINIVCLFLLIGAGCKSTVLEFPEGEGVDPTLVNVNLNLTVDPTMVPYIPVRSDAAAVGTHDVRWIVEVFRDEIGEKPEVRQVLGCEPGLEGHHSIRASMALHAARYRVVVWMEFVDKGSVADKYYKVGALSSISILDKGDYIGNDDHKDTYVAQQEVDLRSYRDRWNETVEQTVTLQRPMAKIELITTDVEKFLDKVNARRSKAGNGEDESAVEGDLSSFQVVVEYAGYFPSGFNAYTNKPNASLVGMSFPGEVEQLSGKEARLASDYIFVNGSESAVMVNLEIRNSKGELVNRAEGIKVPIVRGKLTTVRDEFLTNSYSPGIGIDPGFDGNIDVVIPD